MRTRRASLVSSVKTRSVQQMDGDSLFQSIVAGLRERNRKGFMEGLRNCVKVDNHRALEVGHLGEVSRPFQVRRPTFKERSCLDPRQ